MNKSFAILFLGLTACNYDAGECYVRGEEGDGVGGGVITPGGAGGFGAVPPEPQGAPSPADPCSATAECTVTWKAGSDHCKEKGTAGTCTTLYQGAHTSLARAKERCEVAHGVGIGSEVQSCGPCQWVTSANGDCLEHCKDKCVEVWEGCYDACGKDHVCRERCIRELAECNKECERKCK
jgi:hypothetical protein